MPDDHPFALCLTHDTDRPHKRLHQALFYALGERNPEHLRSILGDDPYWQFEEIMALEEDLGVRSAFYFLDGTHLGRLLREAPGRLAEPAAWIQHLGRYDVESPAIVEVIRTLAAGGWEVGLHGSYYTADDPDGLRREKARIERVLDAPVIGGRQHYLNLSIPETWRHHVAIGLQYDATLGSGTDYGFRYGYEPLRPFADEPFVVFPLTLMEQALPDPGTDFDAAWNVCRGLLEEAAANDATMTVLWHPRYFNEAEFPGYRRLYRRLVERALAMDAWVGPPAELYDRLAPASVPTMDVDAIGAVTET